MEQVFREGWLEVGVGKEYTGVDACIGATRTQGGDFLGGEFFERLFQFVLDSEACALALPALIGLTVVGDAQRDSHCKVFAEAGEPKSAPDGGVDALRSKFKAAMSAGNSFWLAKLEETLSEVSGSVGFKVLKAKVLLRP